MNITSNQVKISGTAELPKGLELGKDYEIVIKGSVVKVEHKDLFNGEFESIATIKIALGEVKDELGDTFKIKDARNNSQKARSLNKKLWLERGGNGDFEAFHDRMYACYFKFANQFADDVML